MVEKFITESGIIISAITADQMREVDRIAVEETGPNLYQMMENAGRSLALFALDLMGDQWKQARYVVLSGTGGNGGGGICAARHLANRDLNVRLVTTVPNKLGEVPARQRSIFRATVGKEVAIEELDDEPVDLVVDALIGYSLKGALKGPALDLIRWANAQQSLVLSLDVPSGVDATSGDSAGEYIDAAAIMTLALPKTGLIPEKTGILHLADLGIPVSVYNKLGITYTDPFENRYRVGLRPA